MGPGLDAGIAIALFSILFLGCAQQAAGPADANFTNTTVKNAAQKLNASDADIADYPDSEGIAPGIPIEDI